MTITNSPPSRRKFAHLWDEIDYLYHKILYWFYEREEPRQSRLFADRLEQLLKKEKPEYGAILLEECWSLVHEIKGDLRKAIRHREQEIDLIQQLHKITIGTENEEYVLDRYGLSDLTRIIHRSVAAWRFG